MPQPQRLALIADLRKAAGITLAQMAAACGLRGRTAYESASAWERGVSIPHARVRPKFITYLARSLHLAAHPEQMEAAWSVICSEWGWEPLTHAEWASITAGDAYLPGIVTVANASDGSVPSLPNRGVLPRPAALPPGSRVPFSRNPTFVGRSRDLRALAAVFTETPFGSNEKTWAAAATGMGGLGKTQVAVEFVHRYGQFFPGGVFWLSFANPDVVPAEVAACGGVAHLDLHPSYDRLSLTDQLQLVGKAWREPLPRLLVFDNCEEPKLLEAWLPNAGGCKVLITSRRSAWPARLGVQILPLSVLPRRRSIDLLRNHRRDLPSTDVDLNALAAELDDLPLALHLAGHYLALAGSRLHPAAYVEQLRALAPGRLIDLSHPSLASESISPTGHIQHVARTFALSYEQLRPTEPRDIVARMLLAHSARYAPGELIPEVLLSETLTDAVLVTQVASALQRLFDLGLLEEVVHGAQRWLRMHRLIVSFVQQVAPDPAAQRQVEEVITRKAQHLNASCDQPALLTLQIHLRAVTDAALGRHDAPAATLAYELSRHLGEIEQYAEAMQYNQRSLAIREHCFGSDAPQIAENLHYLGELLDWQGDYAGARPHHLRALAIRQRTLGDDHSDTATSLNHVGEILHALCDYPNAQTYYEQALSVFQHRFGPDHPAVADVSNNLGLLLNAMGIYAAALPYAERAVAIWETIASPHGPRQAMALNNLGYLLRAQGRYRDAQPILERALAIREEIYGPKNTAVGVTLNHLGRIAYYLGDTDAAQRYLERAIAIFTQALGSEHPITASALGNLGMLYLDRGDLAQAQPRLEQALTTHQHRCGPDHRHTGRSINRLGLCFAQAGDQSRAHASFETALTIRERILGPSHHDTANTNTHIGMLLLESGDAGAARPYLERGLHSNLDQLGTAHHYTARSMLAMSRLLQATGDDATARAYYSQALSIYRQTLGDHHPFTVKARALDDSKV